MVFGVDLEAAAGVGDDDAVVFVDFDAGWSLEPPHPRVVFDLAVCFDGAGVAPDDVLPRFGEGCRVALEGGKDFAVGFVCLHAAVSPVGDVDVALAVDGDVCGVVQFAAELFAECHHIFAVVGELLHAVVAPVCDVDAAVGVDGDAPGAAELSRRATGASESGEVLSVFGEFLHAVAAAFDYDDVVVCVEGDAVRPVQLSGLAAGLAPGCDPFIDRVRAGIGYDAVWVVFADDVVLFVGGVDPSFAVEGDAARPGEVLAGEVAEVVFVEGGLADAPSVPAFHLLR